MPSSPYTRHVSILLHFLFVLSTCTASLFGPFSQKPLSVDKPQSNEANTNPKWTLNFSSPHPHLFTSIPTLLHQWSNTIFPNGHTLAAVEIPAYTLLYHGLISPEDPYPEPPSPEWLAFDLEMSYGIMGSSRSSFLLTYQTTRPVKALYFDGESASLMGWGQLDTQMLQLFGNVTGPDRDGGRGFVGLGEEYLRAHGLCNWLEEAGLRGRGWGFEGVVRMNAGFEVIWCDFVSPSLRLVSRVNVTAPLLPEEQEEIGQAVGNVVEEELSQNTENIVSQRSMSDTQDATSYYPLPPQPTKTDRNAEPSHPAAPPNMRWGDRNREPFLRAQGWSWFDSATWHYGSTRNGPGQGEVRAKVLSCGVLSYYSPQFVNQTGNRALEEQARLNLTSEGLWMGPRGYDVERATAIKQLARRRRFHHLGNVTREEAMLMRQNSERALHNVLDDADGSCSGADWTLITSEIVQRVTNQLTMMDTKLTELPAGAEAKNKTDMHRWLFDLRGQSHLFMVPYLEYPQTITHDTWTTNTELYKTTHARCRYRYTRLLVPEELHDALTPEERDIREAVEEVYGTICTVLITLGFGIELAWLDMMAIDSTGQAKSTAALSAQAAKWHDNIAELTAWLGWESEYYGCKEMCAWDERCYIPMWPLMHRGRMGGRPGRGPGGRKPGNGTHGGPPRGHWNILEDDELPPEHGGPGHGGPPGFKMPPRGPWWMGDDTDLWEPRCVNVSFIMGDR